MVPIQNMDHPSETHFKIMQNFGILEFLLSEVVEYVVIKK
jgi:hypothetical protein